MKIHASKEPLPVLKPKSHGSKFGENALFYNPNGFWYTCGDIIWDDRRPYRYAINTDKLNMRSIGTVTELDTFVQEFMNPHATTIATIVDWKKVYTLYDGLELCPYLGTRMKYSDLFQQIHHYTSFQEKGKIGEYLMERSDSAPSQFKDELEKLLHDSPKYRFRIWCIGWEVASGVVWKNYSKLGISKT